MLSRHFLLGKLGIIPARQYIDYDGWSDQHDFEAPHLLNGDDVPFWKGLFDSGHVYSLHPFLAQNAGFALLVILS